MVLIRVCKGTQTHSNEAFLSQENTGKEQPCRGGRCKSPVSRNGSPTCCAGSPTPCRRVGQSVRRPRGTQFCPGRWPRFGKESLHLQCPSPWPEAPLATAGADALTGKGVTGALVLTVHELHNLKNPCQKPSSGNVLWWCICTPPPAAHAVGGMRLIYRRGVFGVARSDREGNVKAYEPWNGQQYRLHVFFLSVPQPLNENHRRPGSRRQKNIVS